jgi:hypothetical protein
MMDDLIDYISNNLDIQSKTNIEGMEIERANKINVSNSFKGHMSFLAANANPEQDCVASLPKCMEQAPRPDDGGLLQIPTCLMVSLWILKSKWRRNNARKLMKNGENEKIT